MFLHTGGFYCSSAAARQLLANFKCSHRGRRLALSASWCALYCDLLFKLASGAATNKLLNKLPTAHSDHYHRRAVGRLAPQCPRGATVVAARESTSQRRAVGTGCIVRVCSRKRRRRVCVCRAVGRRLSQSSCACVYLLLQ